MRAHTKRQGNAHTQNIQQTHNEQKMNIQIHKKSVNRLVKNKNA